jgi:hypothetical protein
MKKILVLAKETLRTLDEQDLSLVAGGGRHDNDGWGGNHGHRRHHDDDGWGGHHGHDGWGGRKRRC